ncbi:MAG: Processive diacylglycerol beta-glucosyltransferase [Phycisphaerae bacterium]|nr:Processive diacylglycerol beta-glucosyltransferase [Phycisphaerae bacterium]
MRILVLSASVGAGHTRAAQAVELALKELAPQATIRHLDVLELTNAAFRRIYSKTYLDLNSKAPHFLGYMYDLLDRPPSRRAPTDKLRLLVQRMSLRRFIRFLKSEPWDLIINSHFLPQELIAALRRRRQLHTPQFTVTTDFDTHRLWVHSPCDHYFTATIEGALYLQSWGIPVDDITATGIPIHPVFSKPKVRAQCLRNQQINGDRPIILQLAGGFGTGPVDQLYQTLIKIEPPAQFIVVAGRNEKLRQRLQRYPVPPQHRVHIMGFTDQIDELMTIADIVVTKPGGLTTSEALARGVALMVVNPVPGQESHNCDYLLENGAALRVNHLATVGYKLTRLLNDPQRLTQLKENARQLGKSRAAYDVAQYALNYLAQKNISTTP